MRIVAGVGCTETRYKVSERASNTPPCAHESEDTTIRTRQEGRPNKLVHIAGLFGFVTTGNEVPQGNGSEPMEEALQKGNACRQVFKLEIIPEKGEGRCILGDGHEGVEIVFRVRQQHCTSDCRRKDGQDFQGKCAEQQDTTETLHELGRLGILVLQIECPAAYIFVNSRNDGTRHQRTGITEIRTPFIGSFDNVRDFPTS